MSLTVESASESIITQDVIDYFESLGINIEDGTSSSIDIDSELLMAYYQYAFVQMCFLVYGDDSSSGLGDVQDYDAYMSTMSSDDIAVINQILQDDPELMAYYAYQAGGQSESDAVMSILDSLATEAGGSASEGDPNGAYGSVVDLAYDTQTETDASLAAIFAYMDELNQVTFGLSQDLNLLSPDDEAGILSIQSQIDVQSAQMQVALTMVQSISDQSSTTFSLLSAMIKNQLDSEQAVINNFKVSA